MSSFADTIDVSLRDDTISADAERLLLERSADVQEDKPTIDTSLKNLLSYILAIYITRNSSSVTSSNDFNDNNVNNSDSSRDLRENLVTRFEKLDHVITADIALKAVQIMSKSFNRLLSSDDDGDGTEESCLPDIGRFVKQLQPQGDHQSASARLDEIINYKTCYFLYLQVKKAQGKITKLFGRLFLRHTRAFDVVEKIAVKLNGDSPGLLVPAQVLSIFCDVFRLSLAVDGDDCNGDGLRDLIWSNDFKESLRLRQADRASSRKGAGEEEGVKWSRRS